MKSRKIIVTRTLLHGREYAKREGFQPKDVLILATEIKGIELKLRGLIVDPKDVIYIEGWNWGKYADAVIQALRERCR